MEHAENQELILREDQPFFPYALVYDSVDEYLFQLISLTGATQGICSTYGNIIMCNDPNDKKCSSTVNRNALYIALGFALAELVIKVAKRTDCFTPCKNFNQVVDTGINILGNHNFFLLAGASIAAAAAHSPNIENWKFWVYIALPSFVSAIFLNANIRYKIRERYWKYPSQDDKSRGILIRILDSFASFLEGSISMIGSISTIEQIHDALNKISCDSPDSWVYSKAGMSVRYSIGGAYGIFQSLLRWRYSPIIKEDEILQNRWPSIVQSIFNFITFAILTGFAISKNQIPDIALMTFLCLLLIVGGLIHAGINIMQNYSQIPEKNHTALAAQDDNNPDHNFTSNIGILTNNIQIENPKVEEITSPTLTCSTNTNTSGYQIGNIAKKIMMLFKPESDERSPKNLGSPEYGFNTSQTGGLSTPGI